MSSLKRRRESSSSESPNTKRRRINRERREEISRQDREYEEAQMNDIMKQIAKQEEEEKLHRQKELKKELLGLLNMEVIPKEIVRERSQLLDDDALAKVIMDFVEMVHHPTSAMDYILRVRHKLQLIESKLHGKISIDLRNLQRQAAMTSRIHKKSQETRLEF